MDVPSEQSTPAGAAPPHLTPREAVRSTRRRRPTGAPPPLPHHLQTSGVGWLVAAVVLVGLALAVFAPGLRGPAVAVTVADDAVVRWLGGLHVPGLEVLWQGLAYGGSWWALATLESGLLLALLVLRRWRHLLVWLLAWPVVNALAYGLVATAARRPRPFGVDLRTGWGGWAMPAAEVAIFAAVLVAILYTLVPEGRWRNTGKWVAAGLVALVGVARIALGVDAPADVLVGVGIGVAIPLLAFRWFRCSRSCTGGAAAPIWTSAGHAGWRSAGPWRSSWAWPPGRSSLSGWPARPALPRCGSRSAMRQPGSCSASSTPAAICVPTAGTSSAGSCCMAGWRTRSRSAPCGGWWSRRTTRCA